MNRGVQFANPFRIGLESAMANAVPMAVLWTVAVATAVCYYAVPGVAGLFEPLANWQRENGAVAAFLSLAVFCGVIPGVFIYSVMGTLNAFLRGYGVSVAPAVINIFALFVFRLIWSFAYFPHHRTLFHLYISYPIGWLIAIVMLLVIYRPAMGKAMERLEAEARERAG